jgi:hypothetical protein
MSTHKDTTTTVDKSIQRGAGTPHTPGPWTLRIDSEKHYAILDEGGFPRAEVFSAHRSTDRRKAEALANARLIAAAPDLLEACLAWERARKEGGISMVDWFNVAWEKTQAAIAKAEGSDQ